ncbi:diphosphomevalonate decarboxylase-like isoform X2 [Corticium candelabrum]|nr:diphosphomevalonate decarboxylase-like isoform X2 [Corticium candelabrum]
MAKSVTCSAPVNIAVIKYWGKRDEELVLPVNSSLSATLHQNELRATTTVSRCESFDKDRMWLNGREQSIDNPRLQACLREIRKIAENGRANEHIHICSVNNFPTAAGLASSAAGYACLVFSLAKLFEIEGDTSTLARQGSGSACRSMYGGFVRWNKGSSLDGSDSCAVQIVSHNHWPELEVLILVVNDQAKGTSSTVGMRRSVETSELLKHRAEAIVPPRLAKLEKAIQEKDFNTFGLLTMQESNQFHAVCLDTYPPIVYMSEISRQIVNIVTCYNDYHKTIKAAYTFDAGPNAVVYVQSGDIPEFLALVKHFFPPSDSTDSFIRGRSTSTGDTPQIEELLRRMASQLRVPGALRYIIHTAVGPGPQVLDPENSLLGPSGLPKTQ